MSACAKKLQELGQEHLLDQLSPECFKILEKDLLLIDSLMLSKMRACLVKEKVKSKQFEPFLDYTIAGDPDSVRIGKEILAKGSAGCLIVAGGQGTRLGMPSNSSKGTFPLSIVKKKTLFQIFAEKTKAASCFAKQKLPLAIMTSPLNHDSVVQHFEQHNFFGLDVDQVRFFKQNMLPFLDDEGNLFLESKDHIAMGPSGNGQALSCFYSSGIWHEWKSKGICFLSFIQIDNPLADPFDLELLGFHKKQENDVTIKCALRDDLDSKVGLLVKQENQCKVIEYLEFPEEAWNAKKEDGGLLYACANLSLFCFSFDFIQQVALDFEEKMPFHAVKKTAKHFQYKQIQAWKFEKFIFDVLAFSKHTKALLFPKNSCFAPLKNSTGKDSIESVLRLMQEKDAAIYQQVTGTYPPKRKFELSQDFYYPTSDLLKKWKGYKLPDQEYIEP